MVILYTIQQQRTTANDSRETGFVPQHESTHIRVFCFMFWSFTSRPTRSITFARQRHVPTSSIPTFVLHEASKIQSEARKALETYDNSPSNGRFAAVKIALPLHNDFFKQIEIVGEPAKFIPGFRTMSLAGKSYIVYGFGVANDPSFENTMSSLGSSVYGFDCTVKGSDDFDFEFHPWCLGTEQDFEQNIYTAGIDEKIFTFHGLRAIMNKLHHAEIDMLKMDIEGFEWSVLYSEIIETDVRPELLMFELHTEGANPVFVPKNVVAGRDGAAVADLFLKLFDIGYRVMHVDVNPGDSHCAEFALAYLNSNGIE